MGELGQRFFIQADWSMLVKAVQLRSSRDAFDFIRQLQSRGTDVEDLVGLITGARVGA